MQIMELFRHHMTISQPKYRTSVVNSYAIDNLLFSIYILLQLLETRVLRCIHNRRRSITIRLLELIE